MLQIETLSPAELDMQRTIADCKVRNLSPEATQLRVNDTMEQIAAMREMVADDPKSQLNSSEKE